jgi:hypothetical protein
LLPHNHLIPVSESHIKAYVGSESDIVPSLIEKLLVVAPAIYEDAIVILFVPLKLQVNQPTAFIVNLPALSIQKSE